MVAVLSVLVTTLLGFPSIAWAWGSGAHVDFGLAILGNLALLTPALRALLKRHPKDYLYGNLAADTVLAKNLADEQRHVHNWEVAIRLFDLCEDDAGRAFVHGYLSHLAADTVAHNYFVPKKRVDSYRSITTGHAYWELRYDSFLPESVWEASRELGTHRFDGHDRLLEHGLQATILSVSANRQVYRGFLALTRRVDRWRELMRAHAARSVTPFPVHEREEIRELAIGAISAFLVDFRESATYLADPTGNGNLDRCWEIGARLRRNIAAGKLDAFEADAIAHRVGRALREGLHVRREADLVVELNAAGA